MSGIESECILIIQFSTCVEKEICFVFYQLCCYHKNDWGVKIQFSLYLFPVNYEQHDKQTNK